MFSITYRNPTPPVVKVGLSPSNTRRQGIDNRKLSVDTTVSADAPQPATSF
jgi:hypothetical protein